jgi:hypothetical protein
MTQKLLQNRWLLAAWWVGACLHAPLQAQTRVNDSGTFNVAGQIAAATCVLNMGDSASTLAGVKTLNLGRYANNGSSSGVLSTAAGTPIGNGGVSTVFSLTDAAGGTCTSLGSGKWDIGINPPAAQVVQAGDKSLLLTNNLGGANVTAWIGAWLRTSTGTAPTTGSTTVNLFSTSGGAYGVLLGGNAAAATGPTLNATDKIALTVQFARQTDVNTPTTGVYVATVPLNVWYK